MPRRTDMDRMFDNDTAPTPEEMMATAALMEAAAEFPLDAEDEDEINENDHGTGGADEMDDEDYRAAISKAIEAAEDYIDSELSPDREVAAQFYRAEKFGNEIEGRSQVVMSSVRDTVLGVMPALLRIFCGNTDAVEFVNSAAVPSMLAKAQTAYINHIIQKDNDGFIIFHSAFKDGLVKKTGIFTWWHEEKEIVTQEELTGLNEEAYALLQIEKAEGSDESTNISYEIEVLEERPDTTNPDADGQDPGMLMDDPNAQPPQNFIRDVRIKKRQIIKRHRVEAVPPEELILVPVASSNIDDFPLIGRRQMKTIGELVAIGHDEEAIHEAIGEHGQNRGSAFSNNPERTERMAGQDDKLFDTGFSDVDPASDYVKYFCGYIMIDRDGDGLLERRKICTVGDNNHIIYDQIVEYMVPYAFICPDPEPHAPFGYSLADQAMDMQEIKSEMIRGVLDSLSESIFGRTAIVEGQVNIDDALSNARDQLIRVKNPDAIRELSKPFNGMNAMPVLEYLDNMLARRTGITMSPSGLSPDVLQSTSTEAVNATVDASQERSEMIARIFAETGIKRLYRGLLQQVIKHQDQKRMIQLNGRPIMVDPRLFNADLDLDTNVGLGRGTAAKRMAALMFIAGQQKEVITTYGLGNPVVTMHHISNTMEDIIRESGFNDVSRYMTVVSEEQANQMRDAAMAEPKKPTPEELLYQAQVLKITSDAERAANAEAVRLQIADTNAAIQKDKNENDFYIRTAEIMGKFGIQVTEQEIRARERDEDAADQMAQTALTAGQAALQPPQEGEQ